VKQLVKIHLVLLVVALIITFVLFPVDMLFFDGASNDDVQAYYKNAVTFEKMNAWKIFFTWFLGLTCGRLIVRALKDPSANIDQKHKR